MVNIFIATWNFDLINIFKLRTLVLHMVGEIEREKA